MEFESKPAGLDFIDNKLLIWGKDFYSYDGRNNQAKTS